MKFSIELKNISAGYNRVNPEITDINLIIAEREFLGIIGPNGGGKTTLLKVITGLLDPFRGSIHIGGKTRSKFESTIGYVPQYSYFDATYPIRVKDVVSMGLISKSSLFSYKTKTDERVYEVLEKVGLASKYKNAIGHLSGGEHQRVLIARALAPNPNILILDEPTASIDTQAGASIYELLEELNKTKTIILVSHDIGAISNSVKKIACMNKNLVYHDTKEITKEMLEEAYKCPIDLIAHGVPHRVLDHHHH